MSAAAAPLRGQVILVTGAASGIGAAGAVELRRRGAVLVLLDQDAAGLETTAAAVGGDPLRVTADVTSALALQSAVADTVARHGRLDMVWANAGMASFGPLALTDPVAWQRCIDVNVMGSFHTVRAALPALLRSRGHIALTASVASFAHPPMMSAYAASKAALEAMANAWRIELAAAGVGVSVIHPSWVRTPLVDEGELHPGFLRLRQTAPPFMRQAVTATAAACRIADGLERRADRIWVPGWVRLMHLLRALLHTRAGERELRRAAPELEALYRQGLDAEGVLASSLGPREFERAVRRQGERPTDTNHPPHPLP